MEELSELEILRDSGEYPVMDLSIFESIDDIKLSDFTQELQYELLQKYQNIIAKILNLPLSQQTRALKALKEQDVIDSQTLELLDPYFISIRLGIDGIKNTGIQYLLNQHKESQILTIDQLKKAHSFLLRGTDEDYETSDNVRKDNEIFVSKSGQGDLQIHYFPIDYKLIDPALEKLIDYYNKKLLPEEYINQAIILHGLIGALQLFKDGNTRLARLIQTIKIYEMTKETIDDKLEGPVLYASNMYKLYRAQYRDLIAEIAINSNDENWNKWLRFNFNRMDEQLNKTSLALRLER